MKIRAVVLTVLTVLLAGVPSFPQETFVNDPNMPFVKVHSVVEDGKILLKLQNGFHRTVQLKGVFIVSKGIKADLLEEAEELLPADTRHFDVSSHLVRCFDKDNSVRQEKLIKIQLRVEPEPKGQPQELLYRVCYEGGIFTEFEKSKEQAS